MQANFDGTTMRIVPESKAEVEKINDLFPPNYLKSSKVIKVKEMVDKFGESTGDKYLVIRGFSPASSKKGRVVKGTGMYVKATEVGQPAAV